jgi:hypothetical protein
MRTLRLCSPDGTISKASEKRILKVKESSLTSFIRRLYQWLDCARASSAFGLPQRCGAIMRLNRISGRDCQHTATAAILRVCCSTPLFIYLLLELNLRSTFRFNRVVHHHVGSPSPATQETSCMKPRMNPTCSGHQHHNRCTCIAEAMRGVLFLRSLDG